MSSAGTEKLAGEYKQHPESYTDHFKILSVANQLLEGLTFVCFCKPYLVMHLP